MTVVSVDANFGLVRKKSAGLSVNDPKFHGKFFLDQGTLDKRILESSKAEKAGEGNCSNFQAGNSLRSRIRNKQLDETAVFGSACKHEIPKLFCSIKYGGEKLEYAVEILEKLKMHIGDHKLMFMYDIACVLEPYISKRSPHLLDNVTLAVPVFHGYAHKLKCQVQCNPRRLTGAGLTDGECMERLWSYLRKFSKMTKEMSPENRVDTLTCALLHYTKIQRGKLGTTLVNRLERARCTYETSKVELENTLQKLNVSIATVQVWSVEEVRLHTESNSATVSKTWKEEYANLLYEMEVLRKTTSLTSENQTALTSQMSVEKKMKSIERKHKISHRWLLDSEEYQIALLSSSQKGLQEILMKLWKHNNERCFLANLMKKYADGQSIAARLSKSMKKLFKEMTRLVKNYNTLLERCSRQSAISIQDVTDKDWPGWTNLQHLPHSDSQTGPFPLNMRRECIDILHIFQRSQEEVSIVKK